VKGSITLVEPTDAYSFYLGAPIALAFPGDPPPPTRARRVWRRLTWWRYPPSIVVAIDQEQGSITLASTRWSWSRWKWVRI
jgi:hypothetical protein